MKSNKSAFTLIELLVVIAIIGLLASLSVISLSSARSKARDVKRAADVKQVSTALEMFFNDAGRYPTSTDFVDGTLVFNGTTYMSVVPLAPNPPDGACDSSTNAFSYTQTEGGASYTLSFCTGGNINQLAAGPKCVTPGGIMNYDCSSGGVSSLNISGHINYGTGDYIARGNSNMVTIYPFRLIDGSYYVYNSDGQSVLDDESGSNYNVDWTWDKVPGADGYIVLRNFNEIYNYQIGQLNVAEGSFHEIASMLQRVRELLVRITNDTYTLQDKHNINQENVQLAIEIDRVMNNTSYNGVSPFSGLSEDILANLQTLSDNNDQLAAVFDLIASSNNESEINSYSTNTVQLVDSTLEVVSDARESIGNTTSNLESQLANGFSQVIYTNSLADNGVGDWNNSIPSYSDLP